MISVIIPTYNREKTILRSVNSVLNQTIKNLEVIVVDDCSTDNTVQLLEKIEDKRLRVLKHKTNKGACEARNTGILNAKGDYIAFQDSDDAWRHNKLELQIAAMDTYGCNICICQMMRYGYKNSGIYPDVNTGVINYKDIIGSFIVSTQTIVAKREVFEDALFDPKVKRMQDYDWIVRAAKNNKVCSIAVPLVDVYLQENSITTYNYKKLIESFDFFLDKYDYMLEDYKEISILMTKCKAYIMTLHNLDASNEYKQLFVLTRDHKYIVKYILSRFKLLNLYYTIKK